MAYVKLLEDYKGNKAGQVVYLPATVARDLINDGKAKGGDLNFSPSYEKSVASDRETRALPDGFPERERLIAAGYDSLAKIKAASDDELLDIKYIGPKSLEAIRGST